MMRPLSLLCLLLASLSLLPPASAAELIPEPVAAKHGLTRAWFAQAPMDPSRGRLRHVVLADGTLFVQTQAAVVQALDPETGSTLWTVQVGTAGYPTLPVDARGDFVVVINGTTLYLLNRYDGKLLWQKRLEGAPGAAPALSDQHVFVPMVSGIIYAYRLRPMPKVELKLEEEEAQRATPARPKPAAAGATPKEASKEAPKEVALSAEDEQKRRHGLRLSQEPLVGITCPSTGQAFTRPLVTLQNTGQENISWTTSRGYLFTGKIIEDHFTSVYRLSTGGPMSTEPTYLPPDGDDPTQSGILFGASEDGFVYAVKETTGDLIWRFSAADPISQRAVVIGKRIYAPTETAGMYCLNAENSEQIWWQAGLRRFLVASKERLYTMDQMGRVAILHAQTGARLDAFDLPSQAMCLTNDTTDRLYVYSPSGLVQCLREVDQVKPLEHRPPRRPAPVAEENAAPKGAAPAAGPARSPRRTPR